MSRPAALGTSLHLREQLADGVLRYNDYDYHCLDESNDDDYYPTFQKRNAAKLAVRIHLSNLFMYVPVYVNMYM